MSTNKFLSQANTVNNRILTLNSFQGKVPIL